MNLKKIASICKQFRIESGITVKELASKCNYTVANVYKFERGELNNALILMTYIYYLGIEGNELWQA